MTTLRSLWIFWLLAAATCYGIDGCDGGVSGAASGISGNEIISKLKSLRTRWGSRLRAHWPEHSVPEAATVLESLSAAITQAPASALQLWLEASPANGWDFPEGELPQVEQRDTAGEILGQALFTLEKRLYDLAEQSGKRPQWAFIICRRCLVRHQPGCESGLLQAIKEKAEADGLKYQISLTEIDMGDTDDGRLCPEHAIYKSDRGLTDLRRGSGNLSTCASPLVINIAPVGNSLSVNRPRLWTRYPYVRVTLPLISQLDLKTLLASGQLTEPWASLAALVPFRP